MATNGSNIVEDAEMADCNGEKVVTMIDVLQEEQDFEDDANAVLGASDEKNCTYSEGYIKRQAIYACLTCCFEAKDDPTKRAGVCLACSLNCHENHELVELYTKRNFRCDCGNPKFNSHPCQFTSDKSELNVDNEYNQNFSGLYCNCHRPYPDPESTVEDDEMIQCIICEDWLHSSHLDAVVPGIDQYSEMVCKICMENNEFLHDYSSLAVNVEMGDVDVFTVNGADVKQPNGDLEGEKFIVSSEVPSENTSDKPKNGMDIDEEPVDNKAITENIDTLNGEATENLEFNKAMEESKDESNEVETEANKKDDPFQTPESSNENTDFKGDENIEMTLKESTKAAESPEESTKPTEEALESQSEDKNSTEHEEVKQSLPHNDNEPPNTTTEVNLESNDTKEAPETTVSDISETNKLEDVSELTEAKEPTTSGANEPITSETNVPTTSEANESITSEANELITSEANEPKTSEANEPIASESNESITSEANEEITSEDKETTTTEVNELINSEISKVETVKPDEQSQDPDTNSMESNENENDLSTKTFLKTTSTEPEIESTTASNDIQMDDKSIGNDDSKAILEDMSNNESTKTEKPLNEDEIDDSIPKLDSIKSFQNGDIIDEVPAINSIEASNDSVNVEDSKDKKRKLSTEEVNDENLVKKPKLNEETCTRPKGIKRVHKGATFWPSNFRQKLCTCCECLSMYKDLSVLFLIDPEDTVMAYETLGKERVDGRTSQYEKGLEALSSLDRIQQINALTEYNKMKDKLLDFLKSFKDRKEVVKEEDIKAFFAGMKPKREPDGVYFCR